MGGGPGERPVAAQGVSCRERRRESDRPRLTQAVARRTRSGPGPACGRAWQFRAGLGLGGRRWGRDIGTLDSHRGPEAGQIPICAPMRGSLTGSVASVMGRRDCALVTASARLS